MLQHKLSYGIRHMEGCVCAYVYLCMMDGAKKGPATRLYAQSTYRRGRTCVCLCECVV